MRAADVTDLTRATEIRQKPGFFVAAGVFVALLTLASGFLTVPVLSNARDLGETALSILMFALISGVLAVTTLNAARRAILGRAVVMRLCPKGIWHLVSTRGRLVAWSDVQKIVLRGGKGGGLKLTLGPEAFRSVIPGTLARAIHRLNWLDGPSVLSIHIGGLEMPAREVVELTRRYAAAHGGPKAG